MAEALTDQPTTMPKVVRWAIAGLSFEIVLYVAAALLLFADAKSSFDHGQSGGPSMVLIGVLGLALAAVYAACIINALPARRWARYLAIGVELFSLFARLLGLLGTLVTLDAIGILVTLTLTAITGAVVWLLFTPQSRVWFTR